MKIYELREQGFSVQEKIANRKIKFMVTFFWVLFTVLLIAGTFLLMLAVVGYSPPEGAEASPMEAYADPSMTPFYMAEIIFCLIAYCLLKVAMTIVFCSDKKNSISLKVHEEKGLPMCFCREALTTWQTILIYLVPMILIYIPMFLICFMLNGGFVDGGFMFMLFFMEFFFAFDLALVAYVLALKIKGNINYIAVNDHVYDLTLFKKTYIRAK
ncbi:MAG: hypothetical protein FWG34_04510 [Oscillospiraceae bacterium]|jgi:hypothetical protein|nr:hypothetical protein [Oscillospiraceae bacterium]